MKKHLKESIIGLKSYGKVIPFLSENKLWNILWVSLLANIFLILALFGAFSFFFVSFTDYITQWQDKLDFLPSFLVKSVSIILSILILLYSYRYLALIFLSPLFSYISEKVQYAIAEVEHPLTWKQLIQDISRGIKIAFRNFVRELFFTLFLLGLSFSGVLAPFVPIAIYIVSAYFFGFAMIDYRSETRGLNTTQSIKLIKDHRGIAAGIGVGFKLFLLLPIIGILIAPPFAIVSGALAMEEVEKD